MPCLGQDVDEDRPGVRQEPVDQDVVWRVAVEAPGPLEGPLELMLAQQEVIFERYGEWIDAERRDVALIEELRGENEDGRNVYAARCPHQAPDIDSTTLVLTREEHAPGEVVPVTIVGHDGYDLIAEPTETSEKSIRLNVIG